jgi:uncharacterized protein (UPF0333 family)
MSIKKGQSILEYVILFTLILAALIIMHIYIKRAYQSRIKQGADEVGQQYSPGHTTSVMNAVTSSNSITYTGGTTAEGVEVPDNMTVTQSKTTSSYTRQEGIDSFATEQVE